MKVQVTSAGQRSHRVHPNRQGFTLVELLVVITIIGILVALLIPAVNGVMSNARNAQMSIEINGLASALEAYKLELGNYPPDFAQPTETQDRQQLDSHLARKFRYRNKAQDNVPMEGLDPAEALVFWLYGMGADPKFPVKNREVLAVGTGPIKGAKAFFEFDQKRLEDRDEDGWPEYYPANSEMPYVYLSSQNYGKKLDDGSFAAYAHRVLDNGSQSSPIGVRAYAAELAGNSVKRFVGDEKFQIVCAGQDNEFGAGMSLSEGVSATYPDGLGYAAADDDNLTNFSEGKTLKAATP